jgi:uncharacterized protein YecA (UPF0149 family)
MTDMDHPFDARKIQEALQDPRVAHALEKAFRDRQIKASYKSMRERGVRVADAVERLAEEYLLSEERIRSIVYNKNDGADD